MTDEPNKSTDDLEGSDVSGRPPGAAGDMDEDAALDRLRALTAGTKGRDPKREPAVLRQEVMPARSPRGLRRRPAAAHSNGRMVARIGAPAVFLAAIIILVVLLFQSGMISGGTEVVVSPSPKASAKKAGAATTKKKNGTRIYVVKSGDTLSGIAVKFDTTVSAVEKLNPNVSSSTLVAGAKINIPPK